MSSTHGFLIQVFSGPLLVMYGLLFGPKFVSFAATPTEVGLQFWIFFFIHKENMSSQITKLYKAGSNLLKLNIKFWQQLYSEYHISLFV
jgi:hypothetical protein